MLGPVAQRRLQVPEPCRLRSIIASSPFDCRPAGRDPLPRRVDALQAAHGQSSWPHSVGDQRARLLGRLLPSRRDQPQARPASGVSSRRSGSAPSSISPASTSAASATSSRGSRPMRWRQLERVDREFEVDQPARPELDVERPRGRLVARHLGAHRRPRRRGSCAGSRGVAQDRARSAPRASARAVGRAGDRPGPAQRHMLPGPGLVALVGARTRRG